MSPTSAPDMLEDREAAKSGLKLPYPGLRSFARHEAKLFFGRRRCIGDMLETLEGHRFLAVLGASGSGKSSLVRTGLFEALDAGLIQSAGSRWLVADIPHPGSRPMYGLAEAIEALKEPHPSAEAVEARLRDLKRGPRAVIEWAQGNLPPGHNLLILVDQFEELFRQDDYATRERVEAFIELLLESARSAEAPIYVAMTMRSEFLGATAQLPGLAEAINRGLFLTPWMSRSECEEAIVGPSRVMGFDIQPALVSRLLNDIAQFAPSGDEVGEDLADRLSRQSDQLPLLQHVLNRLWLAADARRQKARVTLTLADYTALGGLEKAMEAHAEAVLKTLESTGPLTERLFRALVTGNSVATAVRRRVTLAGLVQECGDEAGVRRIVDAFRAEGCNFLAPPAVVALSPDVEVDISHESLIRQWPSLRGWVVKEASAAERWRLLLAQARLDRDGQGGWLTGRALDAALAWRKEEQPRAAWAQRYGGEFEFVDAFLNASLASAKRRALRNQASLLLVPAAIVAGALLILFLLGQQGAKLQEANEKAQAEFSSIERKSQAAAEANRVAMARAASAQAEAQAKAQVQAVALADAEARIKTARAEADTAIEAAKKGAVTHAAVESASRVLLAKGNESLEVSQRQALLPQASLQTAFEAQDSVLKVFDGAGAEVVRVPRASFLAMRGDFAADNLDLASAEADISAGKLLLEGAAPSSEKTALQTRLWILSARTASIEGDPSLADARLATAEQLAASGRLLAPDAKDVVKAQALALEGRAAIALQRDDPRTALDYARRCQVALAPAAAETALILARCRALEGLALAHTGVWNGDLFDSALVPQASTQKATQTPEQTMGKPAGARDLEVMRSAASVRLAQAQAMALLRRPEASSAFAGLTLAYEPEFSRTLAQRNLKKYDADLYASLLEAAAAYSVDNANDLLGSAWQLRRPSIDALVAAGDGRPKAILTRGLRLNDRMIEEWFSLASQDSDDADPVERYEILAGLITRNARLEELAPHGDPKVRRSAREQAGVWMDAVEGPAVTEAMSAYPGILNGPENLKLAAEKMCAAVGPTADTRCLQMQTRLATASEIARPKREVFKAVVADAEAQSKPDPEWSARQDVAIEGFDPVAYFYLAKDALPVRGRPQWALALGGVVWLFSSAENMTRFKADPGRFAPQYRGNGADGVVAEVAFNGKPRNWLVSDSKLYLFTFEDERADWSPAKAKIADAAWAKMQSEP